MARLPQLTARELVRFLEAQGCAEDRQTGSHLVLRHGERRVSVTVPIHSAADLGRRLAFASSRTPASPSRTTFGSDDSRRRGAGCPGHDRGRADHAGAAHQRMARRGRRPACRHRDRDRPPCGSSSRPPARRTATSRIDPWPLPSPSPSPAPGPPPIPRPSASPGGARAMPRPRPAASSSTRPPSGRPPMPSWPSPSSGRWSAAGLRPSPLRDGAGAGGAGERRRGSLELRGGAGARPRPPARRLSAECPPPSARSMRSSSPAAGAPGRVLPPARGRPAGGRLGGVGCLLPGGSTRT
jgi:predicted RNA binding protein YcfA (HicA-like mRNA interferase family)